MTQKDIIFRNINHVYKSYSKKINYLRYMLKKRLFYQKVEEAASMIFIIII